MADHPRTAYLVEEIVLERLNKWLCQGFRAPDLITEAQVKARLDVLDDVTEVIREGKLDRLARLFDQLGIAFRQESRRGRLATTSSRIPIQCVREGT